MQTGGWHGRAPLRSSPPMQCDDVESREDVVGADLVDVTVRTVVVDAVVSRVDEEAPAKHTTLWVLEEPEGFADGTDRTGDSDLSDE